MVRSYPVTCTAILQFDAYWERDEAIADLRGKQYGIGEHTRYAGEAQPSSLIELLWKESFIYARHLNQVLQINEVFRRSTKAVWDAEKSLRGAGNGMILKPLLTEYADNLKELGTKLDKTQSEYWNHQYARQGLPAISKDKGRTKILQDRNLDTIFQIRAAELLRSFFASLSLYTIARLVVLAYICADIVDVRDGCLIVLGSEPARTIGIDTTYEKLRAAGLREPAKTKKITKLP